MKARNLSAISNTHKSQCPMFPVLSAWMDLLSVTDVATALRNRRGRMRKKHEYTKIFATKGSFIGLLKTVDCSLS